MQINLLIVYHICSYPDALKNVYQVVLEPQVSPENTSKFVDTVTVFAKNLNQRSLTPRWPLTPHLLRSYVWLYPRIIVSKSHENTSKYVDTVIFFAKNLNQRSLTPRWHLTPHLSRSHVWLYPRIIVSKSHGNGYVDTVINFANYHIHTHTTYILRTCTYYVQNQWSHSLFLNYVQARQKWGMASLIIKGSQLAKN